MSNELEHALGAPVPANVAAIEVQAANYVLGESGGREPWSITTIGEADWALRKLLEVRQHEAAYRDEIALWTAARDRALRAGEFFADALERWGVEQRRVTKSKTFPLAHGTISTRSTSPRLLITDEEAALVWLRENEPTAIRTTEKPMVSVVESVMIGSVIVGFEATNKDTGQIDRQMLSEPVPHQPERVEQVAAALGDEWHVKAITEPAAIDRHGLPVAGFGVSDERITAHVTPLGL